MTRGRVAARTRGQKAALTFPAVELSRSKPIKGFAGMEGLEPSPADFGDRCSANLSYIPKAFLKYASKIRNRPPGVLIPGGGACIEAGQAYMGTSSPSAPSVIRQRAMLFDSAPCGHMTRACQVYK